jgi:hypothetical protein
MEIDGTTGIQDDAVVRKNDAGGQPPPALWQLSHPR